MTYLAVNGGSRPGAATVGAMKQTTTTTVTTKTTPRKRIAVPQPRLRLVKRVRTIVVRTRTAFVQAIPTTVLRTTQIQPRVKRAKVISVTTTNALPAPKSVNELTVRERRRLRAPR